MIKIAFIIDKGFMQSLVDKCRKQLLSDFNCIIELIQWHHDLRKHFPKATEYDYVINFSTHTLFKKDYSHDNLIQIPFISNLRAGISRELYQCIINKEESFLFCAFWFFILLALFHTNVFSSLQSWILGNRRKCKRCD